ncbi:LLM class flavin-dependent oxidoreductase [Rhodococcus opacus]|nr:LLM class flavin-dependent oxidoreductase [Rhodococcus opacus]
MVRGRLADHRHDARDHRDAEVLVALRPGLLSPTLAAQMASTFQWQSQGRLLLNVVTGGEDHEQRTYGDYLDKNQRYARCGEFSTSSGSCGREPARSTTRATTSG